MNLLVVDDDFNSRTGTAHTLADYYPQAVVYQAGSLAEAIARLQTVDVSVVLLDLNMDDSRGIATLVALKDWCANHNCNPRLVVVSGAADMDDQLVVQAIDHCATGFIAKGTQPSVFKSAIDLTIAGSMYVPEKYLLAKSPKMQKQEGQDFNFTLRERQVGALLVQGLTYKQIAIKLRGAAGETMAENTVRVHVQNMAWKLKSADDRLSDGLSARAVVLTTVAAGRVRF